ncbi:hypothetical protein Pelo_12555 [Pelomyxa schiedti]|nr:hypothetical protein Pelo_12555 [Pelomyxa schiedti]
MQKEAEKLLVVPADGAMTYETADNFENVTLCSGVTCCILSMGIFPGMLFRYKDIATQTKVTLTPESVEYHTVFPDCCCHLATKHTTIPLENITDVSMNQNCCLSCCHLKSVEIQTAGSPIAEAVITHLKYPENFRDDVVNARRAIRTRGAPTALAMNSGTSTPSGFTRPEKVDPIAKLKELKELFDMGVLTEQEWQTAKQKIMNSPDFGASKARLLSS